MTTFENSIKELIKDAVREVIQEERKNFNELISKVPVPQEEKSKPNVFQKRDPLSIVRPKELCEMLSISLPTLYRWASEGYLPQKVKLGPNAVGWRYSDIEGWLKS